MNRSSTFMPASHALGRHRGGHCDSRPAGWRGGRCRQHAERDDGRKHERDGTFEQAGLHVGLHRGKL